MKIVSIAQAMSPKDNEEEIAVADSKFDVFHKI